MVDSDVQTFVTGRLEPGLDQLLLCKVRVVDEEIEVAEGTQCGVGVVRADLQPFHQDNAPAVPRSHALQQVRGGQPDHHARVLLLGKLRWNRPSLGAPVPGGHEVNPVQP